MFVIKYSVFHLYLFGFPRGLLKDGEQFRFRPVNTMIAKQRGGRVA